MRISIQSPTFYATLYSYFIISQRVYHHEKEWEHQHKVCFVILRNHRQLYIMMRNHENINTESYPFFFFSRFSLWTRTWQNSLRDGTCNTRLWRLVRLRLRSWRVDLRGLYTTRTGIDSRPHTFLLRCRSWGSLWHESRHDLHVTWHDLHVTWHGLHPSQSLHVCITWSHLIARMRGKSVTALCSRYDTSHQTWDVTSWDMRHDSCYTSVANMAKVTIRYDT